MIFQIGNLVRFGDLRFDWFRENNRKKRKGNGL